MPYQNYPDGLYLLRKRSREKGVYHYGILDIGNRSQLLEIDTGEPVVIHQTPPSIRVDWLSSTGSWEAMTKIIDEQGALARMHQAFQIPTYALFGHNCEQFARFVALGKWESTQLQAAGAVAGLAVLAAAAFSDGSRYERMSRRAWHRHTKAMT